MLKENAIAHKHADICVQINKTSILVTIEKPSLDALTLSSYFSHRHFKNKGSI